ncbi:MAG TPA: pilin [Patescibacteria group bacterium]|nr:pilin [Patescibacteria group bacterium]
MHLRIGIALAVFSFIVFLALPRVTFADCSYPNFCNTQPRPVNNTKDPNPGDPCVLNGISQKYVYSSGDCLFDIGNNKTNSCASRCGFLGTGFCCEPANKSSVPPPPPTGTQAPPCNQYSGGGTKGYCTEVSTAFGPIKTDVAGLTKNVLSILLGLSGGVAILLIIAAGYQLMTSQGNPEKVKEGRERLTAAIVGLLFIIFSVAILQIIGVTILQIPGFK